MKWLNAAALVCLAAAVNGQECNVLDKSTPVLENVALTPARITPIAANFIEDKFLRLTIQEEKGGTSGQGWFTTQERLADGFVATFKFQMDGTGDGFAFIVQQDPRKTKNTLGGVRSNLGFKDVMSKFIAVAIETCTDHDTCTSPYKVSIVEKGADRITPATERKTVTLDAGVKFAKDVEWKATVVYTANDATVSVFLKPASETEQGDAILTSSVTPLTDVWDGPYGYFGFSGSTSSNLKAPRRETANTDILSMSLSQQPSNTIVVPDTVGDEIDWGRTHIFTLSERDTCQKLIKDPSPDAKKIVANLTYIGYEGIENYTLPANVEDYVEKLHYLLPNITYNAAAGVYEMRFDIPHQLKGRWDLMVSKNGVPAANMPLVSALKTKQPDPPPKIPSWGIALLVILIILVVCALVYAVIRLKRYRAKLVENEEDIEAGKEKHRLDILDRTVQYEANPMLGTLDEMRLQLKENEAELARLRDGKGHQYDDNYTIEKLQGQNEKLREEMNKLKREAQQNEAATANYRDLGPVAPTKKREFDQTRA